MCSCVKSLNLTALLGRSSNLLTCGRGAAAGSWLDIWDGHSKHCAAAASACCFLSPLQELGLDSEIVAMACQAAEILMIMRQVRGSKTACSGQQLQTCTNLLARAQLQQLQQSMIGIQHALLPLAWSTPGSVCRPCPCPSMPPFIGGRGPKRLPGLLSGHTGWRGGTPDACECVIE